MMREWIASLKSQTYNQLEYQTGIRLMVIYYCLINLSYSLDLFQLSTIKILSCLTCYEVVGQGQQRRGSVKTSQKPYSNYPGSNIIKDNLINFQNYFESYLDDEGIRDIADVMESEKPLFGENEDPSMIKSALDENDQQIDDELEK